MKNTALIITIVSGLLLGTKGTFAQDALAILAATERPGEIEPITAPFIMPQLKKPQFPDRTFNIVEYGAKNDGTTKNTEAFRSAIEACTAAGGGKVLVPAGNWLTGAIHLKSNVNLHFEDETTVMVFSSEDYDEAHAVIDLLKNFVGGRVAKAQ